jgi:HlyD family secretion protein
MRKVIILLLIVGLIGGGVGFWYWKAQANQGSSFRTAPVIRSHLQANIGATGTIQPEEVIDVGAQVAGRIEKFGTDLRDSSKTIDYGSVVEKDTVLAQIDPAVYGARRDQAKADLAKARADLLQQQAKQVQAQRDSERARSMILGKAISQAEFDAAQAAYETAQANIGVSQAQILQAQAALKEAETNLEYTTVRSPVKGVIIDRRVNVGQTVVASLQAPSLFLIAKDLRRLQIWASVNEADIAHIKIGQPVKFTVDAFPDKVFEGKVLRQGDFPARLNASMTQNVVTYTVVVTTENPDGVLLPYLTANLQFLISEKSDALLVPNAALRYKPRMNQIAPEFRERMAAKAQKTGANQNTGQAPGASEGTKPGAAPEKEDARGTVWVADSGYVRPLRIRVGHSDGVNTEVLGGELTEGTEVVVGEGRPAQAVGDTNPFAPQLFGGKK